jgi:hypothetical protein
MVHLTEWGKQAGASYGERVRELVSLGDRQRWLFRHRPQLPTTGCASAQGSAKEEQSQRGDGQPSSWRNEKDRRENSSHGPESDT